jgi:hypothetical protein
MYKIYKQLSEFCEDNFNVDLYPHQVDVLNCSRPKKIINWGRRCGATTTLVLEALSRAIKYDNNVIYILAPFNHTLQVIEESIRHFVDAPDVKSKIRRSCKTPFHLQIGFDNGSSIAVINSSQALLGHDIKELYVDCASRCCNEGWCSYVKDNVFHKLKHTSLYNTGGISKNSWLYKQFLTGKYNYFHIPTTEVMPEFAEDLSYSSNEARDFEVNADIYEDTKKQHNTLGGLPCIFWPRRDGVWKGC